VQFIPTNDVFHHLTHLLLIHKDHDLITDMFRAQGIEVTRSKIKAWTTKTGKQRQGYREMPREALDAFIDECYKRKFVTFDDE